jgi:hypothetical protein
MRCVVHIGTEKTGTTLLQNWLYLNQKQLSEQRIFLSDIFGKPNNRLLPVFFLPYLDEWARNRKISTIEEKDAFFSGFEDKFSNEVWKASAAHDLFLITSEHFSSRITRREDIEKIKKFLSKRFDEIFLICYFRNQADMAVSLYSTALNVGSVASFDTFLSSGITQENYYYNFKAIADNWASVFGKECCNFKIYDRNNFRDNDLRMDFISALGMPIDKSQLDFSKISSNASLTVLEAAVYRRINEFIPYWDQVNGGMNGFNVKLKEAVAALESLSHGVISTPDSQEILERFDETNRQFFQEYFKSENIFRVSQHGSGQDVTFSLAAVEQIIDQLSEVFLAFVTRDYHPCLYDTDADYLRDIALAIENGKKVQLADALRLMTLAKRARPNGPLIEKKVKEIGTKLRTKSIKESKSRSIIRQFRHIGKKFSLIRSVLNQKKRDAPD